MTDTNEDLRTIKDTNAFLRSLVETPNIVNDYFWMGGVVSRVFTSNLGHTYFTITDEQHTISCMLSNRYKDKALYVTNGTMIDVYGVLQVYQKEAKLQMMVSDVRLVELDESTLDKNVLKQLEAQGLYPRTRRDLPQNPTHISVVTSKHSEALSDFENIYREQNGQAFIELADVLVQGERASSMIAERILEINSAGKSDIILLTRGGGRHEDLSAFNSYEIAEAICKSRIPVVTGIGHQRDETIADRVADQKTISPTDAAYKLAQLSENDTPIQVSSVPQKTHRTKQSSLQVPQLLYLIVALIAIGIIGFMIISILVQN